MDDLWADWNKNKTPDKMQKLLTAADPYINKAVSSYAGGNVFLRSHAKKLAINAFKNYDPNKGTKLTTHLMTQMQPLQRAAREHSQNVKIPERISIELFHLNQARQDLTDKLGRLPSDREIADHTGLSHKRLQHIKKFSKAELAESALTAPSEEGEDETFYPGVNAPDPQKVWMEFVHHDLGPVDQQILEWKTGLYGKPILSTNDIAKKLKITPGAVSQRAAKIKAMVAEGTHLVE